MFLLRNGSGRNGKASLLERITSGHKPDKFTLNDVAQQIVGALILSAPFSVSEEVWTLANSIDSVRLVFLFGMTIFVSGLIIFYTKFQSVARENIMRTVPKRLLSVIVVSFVSVAFLLWMFGVIGQITDTLWIIKLVTFLSFFGAIGASAADILK